MAEKSGLILKVESRRNVTREVGTEVLSPFEVDYVGFRNTRELREALRLEKQKQIRIHSPIPKNIQDLLDGGEEANFPNYPAPPDIHPGTTVKPGAFPHVGGEHIFESWTASELLLDRTLRKVDLLAIPGISLDVAKMFEALMEMEDAFMGGTVNPADIENPMDTYPAKIESTNAFVEMEFVLKEEFREGFLSIRLADVLHGSDFYAGVYRTEDFDENGRLKITGFFPANRIANVMIDYSSTPPGQMPELEFDEDGNVLNPPPGMTIGEDGEIRYVPEVPEDMRMYALKLTRKANVNDVIFYAQVKPDPNRYGGGDMIATSASAEGNQDELFRNLGYYPLIAVGDNTKDLGWFDKLDSAYINEFDVVQVIDGIIQGKIQTQSNSGGDYEV